MGNGEKPHKESLLSSEVKSDHFPKTAQGKTPGLKKERQTAILRDTSMKKALQQDTENAKKRKLRNKEKNKVEKTNMKSRG